MVGIGGMASSFLVDAFNYINQEGRREKRGILNEIVFLVEDGHGGLSDVARLEKFQNIVGQPPFYFG